MAALVLSLLAYSSGAYSSENAGIPSVSKYPSNSSTEDKKSSGAKRDAAITAPSTVSAPISGELDVSSQQIQPKTDGNRNVFCDWIISFLIDIKVTDFFVALFTGLLFYVGLGQLRALRKTVDAAVLQAKAAEGEFLSTHRPRIRVKHLWLQNDIWQKEKVQLRLVIVNHGDTDATIAGINVATWIVHEEQDLPATPPFQPHTILQSARRVLPSGMTYEFVDVSDGRVLTDADNGALRDGKSRLFCFGYIDYLDMRGRIRKTAFCKVLKLVHPRTYQVNARFVDHPDPDYAYED